MLDLAGLEQDFKSQGNTVIEKLTMWAELKADDPCLYYGEQDRVFSFREFNQTCNRIANGLASLGVSKGDRVSVLSNNAFVTAIAMFGTWKLGALYCPINNNYKGNLLTYIINDTNPSVLLADRCFIADLNAIKGSIANLSRLAIYQPDIQAHDYDPSDTSKPDRIFSVSWLADLLTSDDSEPGVKIEETDLANIIYTSGTTGNPKGVVHNHKWIHHYNYYSLKLSHPDNVIYNDLPLYHVGGALLNIAGGIWAGNLVALWDRFSPNEFWNRIRRCGATHALLVDTMIDWLMQQPPDSQDKNHSLKTVNMTPLPANHNEVARRFGIAFVNSGYGSTELGVGFIGMIDELGDADCKPGEWEKGFNRVQIKALHTAMATPCSLVSGQFKGKKGFMGSVAPLVNAKVVDEAGDEVDPDTPGHLMLKHKLPDMMFREYFNNPVASRTAMRGDWFYTSDIVSRDNNDIYYFEDRRQGFIRVRGENISAVTVEQQIEIHPEVIRCAVIGVPGVQGNEQDIAAFLVLKPTASIGSEEIEQWWQENLPKFMWPRYFRILESLPVTATFKVAKHKLEQQLLAELSRGIPS